MAERFVSTRVFLTSAWLCALSFLMISAAIAEELPKQFFAEDVRPILEQHCVQCHSGPKAKGGLTLTNRESMVQGGESGAAVDLEDANESLLLSAINYESFEMPPIGQLPKPAIEKLTRWVRAGAPWPEDVVLATPATNEEEGGIQPPEINDETRAFWSFHAPTRPDVPPVEAAECREFARDSIDNFIAARLAEKGLKPNPLADRQTLIRRATYDLTGLPPTPADVAAFVADESPNAYARLIDRLLASPHYGEKWGRHWLDLVRYAESNSYERDGTKPNAWKYRDYVIDSFNKDKPYDQFIREQLAGDELPERSDQSLVATGYYRLGSWDDEPVDEAQSFYDETDDILTTTCQAFLGLTINCARCHDHKLDPITQNDYYGMLSFFAGVTRYGGPNKGRDLSFSQIVLGPTEVAEQNQLEVEEYEKKLKALHGQIRKVQKEFKRRLPGGARDDFEYEQNRVAVVRKHSPSIFSEDEVAKYERLRASRKELQESAPVKVPTTLGVTELGSTRDMHVLIRGNPHAHGDPVQPHFPTVLGLPVPEITAPESGKTSGRRTVLANWIASPDNPLTARVWVNRIWQYHFGRGLIDTPNNYGLKGNAPSHPQLLDWLAVELIENGWRLKDLHRRIMNSATYRMASTDNPQALAVDPENRLLWRFNLRRLTAEEVRDSILAVSGQLNQQVGGPSFYPDIPPEVLAGQSRPGENWGKSSPEDRARRSVYIFVKRSLVTPLIASFDGADTDFTCPVRFTTTQPTQALSMMNGPYLRKQADKLKQLIEQHESEVKDQVAYGLRQVLQRDPDKSEIARGVSLIDSLIKEDGLTPAAALHSFCVVALNLNEFIYVD